MRKSTVRAIQGIAISAAAPLGWLFIRMADGADPALELAWYPGVYLYMLLGTACVFAAFGAYVGSREESSLETSLHDALTDVYNARYFWRRLEEERAFAERHRRPLSLLIGDLDHFKAVNDAHGHRAGDHVLARVARVLMDARRRGDTVARVGGEEFAVILPDTELSEAVRVAERLRGLVAALSFEAERGRPAFGITISFGAAELRRTVPASIADDLYKSADRALYRAKDAGRNRVEAEGARSARLRLAQAVRP